MTRHTPNRYVGCFECRVKGSKRLIDLAREEAWVQGHRIYCREHKPEEGAERLHWKPPRTLRLEVV
jgi:hypothetical protein